MEIPWWRLSRELFTSIRTSELNVRQCDVPENIHTTPTEGIGISRGGGGGGVSGGRVWKIRNLKKCMKLNWNFQMGRKRLENIPSVGEVWPLSVTTQLFKLPPMIYQNLVKPPCGRCLGRIQHFRQQVSRYRLPKALPCRGVQGHPSPDFRMGYLAF